MKFQVIESFKVKTSREEIELQPGQVLNLPHDKAIKLLNERMITPIEKATYKVYSDALQSYLWVVDTDEDMKTLRGQGIKEAVYTAYEIRKLQGMDKECLKDIHKVKEVFPESTIEEVSPSDN